ncbi:hypothetical protein H4R18_005537 [Coemansia javaensis]|uniref:DUF221-domain-containing protein n=1 Tax=Coemansia javaensis TaxID=2761396 RepID=A0A9W8H5M3_9FUNG|nr:hypothetical protein H4R18_005537 [Coemansia javaensis]
MDPDLPSEPFDPRLDDIFDPSKVPGSSVYLALNGTDLGVQAIVAGSFFLIVVLAFSALRLRWPFIFSPRTRLTITAPPYLSRRFLGWVVATMRTPEAYILNTLGLDTVVFLRFYKMCMRLLLDVAFFSILIVWPINIYWSKTNLEAGAKSDAGGGGGGGGALQLPAAYSVTDYLFNLTLNTSDPRQQWYLVPHIVFVYIFSGLAYYHITKFSSRWASLRWHFLMQSRHAMVSRTVMLTSVPRHLAKNPRELEWFWGPGLRLGNVERVRVCPFNTRLTRAAKERARCLVSLEHAYMKLLGNPCAHPEYDPGRLAALATDESAAARSEERRLLARWAKPSRRPRSAAAEPDGACQYAIQVEAPAGSDPALAGDACGQQQHDSTARPTAWVAPQGRQFWRWRRVDAIDHWRERFLAADREFHQLRDSILRGDDYGHSTTAFVTFEDAATAHMATQLLCYPNPGYMKAQLAPEPRGVYWPNVWISNQRRWAGAAAKWVCIFVIWAFWSVPVILFSSLLTPASLGKVFPAILSSNNNLLRAFLTTTVPSVFLLLFLNMLPWILKQVHFLTGARTKPDIDYSVMTKMWAFLVFNVVLVFGFSGTFWNLIVDAVNRPGTIMQSLASNIPRVGTFFTGYILMLGVGYQPFKLLQLRPVIWHIGRQWLCSTPRDYARLVSPVYIDWYSVYPYPLLVFAIAMVYSTFSPPVVLGAVIYYAIGYPVMKYLLLYVYFHPFETAGMAWPKVCRRMIVSIILYQVVMLTFVIVKGGGWYTFSLVPVIVLYVWFFYSIGWSLEKRGTALPVYLWRNPPPNSSYPPPPYTADADPASQGKRPPLYSMLPATSSSADRGSETACAPDSTEPARTSTRARGASKLSQPLVSSPVTSADSEPRSRGEEPPRRRHGHVRQESNRGVRTREIILARNTAKLVSPGAGSTWHRRAKGRTSPRRYRAPSRAADDGGSGALRSPGCPRQHGRAHGHASGSSRGSNDQHAGRHLRSGSAGTGSGDSRSAAKRKCYKSLAEAATVEGKRLLVSLGKLPGELYPRRAEAGSKAPVAPGGTPRPSLDCTPRGTAPEPGLHHALLAVDDEPALDAEDQWVDSDDSEHGDRAGTARRRRGKMAAQRAREPARHSAGDSPDWDPLEYLKPAADPALAGQADPGAGRGRPSADRTLCMLLTGLDGRQQPAWAGGLARASTGDSGGPGGAPPGLRRRLAYRTDSCADDGSQAAASIIDAEGTQPHDARAPPQRGIQARLWRALHHARDYFLAEFRPAAPILDLTYDRLYSQGIDDGDASPVRADASREPLEDDGGTVLPLRQLITRVLPRTVSRMLGPELDATQKPLDAGLAATAPSRSRLLASPCSTSPTPSAYVQVERPATTRGVSSGAGARRGPLGRRGQSSYDVRHALRRLGTSPLPAPALYGEKPAWAHAVDSLDELPEPPRAPWLAAEGAGKDPLPRVHSRTTSHPVLARPEANHTRSASNVSLPALDAQLAHRRSCHKNSLPAPRVPLTARMVSELNYVARSSITPGCAPAGIELDWAQSRPADEPDGEQLLVANYQRYAVERQSRFEPDEYTDYRQTPMLNFRGILDRGIQDYVHPGLVGELPTLWLPVKRVRHSDDSGGGGGSFSRADSTQQGTLDEKRSYMSALAAAAHRLLQQRGAGGAAHADSDVAVVAAAAAAALPATSALPAPEHAEDVQVCVHRRDH